MINKIKNFYKKRIRGFSMIELFIYMIIVGGLIFLYIGIFKPIIETKAAVMEVRAYRYGTIDEEAKKKLIYIEKENKLKTKYKQLLEKINKELAESGEVEIELAQN